MPSQSKRLKPTNEKRRPDYYSENGASKLIFMIAIKKQNNNSRVGDVVLIAK